MLVWADGFDHYGAFAQLSQAGYSFNNTVTYGNSSASARTGNGYIICGAVAAGIRKPLTTPQRIIGSGVGINVQTVSTPSSSNHGLNFEVTAGGAHTNKISIEPNTSLGFTAWVNGAAVGSSANNLFALNSWYWLEVKATANSGVNTNDSSLEVRFQGQTILTVLGLNINGTWAFVTLGNTNNFANETVWFDDWIIWDTTGSFNTDFSGDRRCNTSYPNANQALQDWTPTTAPAWDRINNMPPIDTEYIEALAVNNISEFQKTGIAINTTDVAGVAVFARAFKSDAGTSTFRIGIHSSATVVNSPTLLPGTSASYFNNIWERDPNGNIAWTKANVDLASVRVTRDG